MLGRDSIYIKKRCWSEIVLITFIFFFYDAEMNVEKRMDLIKIGLGYGIKEKNVCS